MPLGQNLVLVIKGYLLSYMMQYVLYIWGKLKLTLRPPCFMVEFVLVDGVLETTFKVPIIMKIYMCKIQDEAVIIISKN